MKKVFLIILFLILFFVPTKADAHLPGQPAFFRVNGKYAKLYPVLSTSLNDFPLPQDIAVENYIVGDTLHFDIDTSKLPVPQTIINQSKFMWDFDDGGKAEGLKEDHTFKKIGSYVVKLTVDDGTSPQPLLLDSVLMNILPDKNYQLPQSVIQVEGVKIKDPIVDVLTFSYDKQIQLNASLSTASSSKIVSYFWDFGDGQTSTEVNPVHQYKNDLHMVFPLLRVKDGNGFISDNFVQIDNAVFFPKNKITQAKSITPVPKKSSGNNTFKNVLIGVIVLGLISFGTAMLFKKRPA